MKRLAFATMVLITLYACSSPVADFVELEPLVDAETADARTVRSGLVESLAPAKGFERFGHLEGDRVLQSEAQMLEVLLSYGPTGEPTELFILAALYIASNQQDFGIAFFERLLERYEHQMSERVRAWHLSAYALLRATWVDEIPLRSRIGWMWETFELVEEARALASVEDPIPRWTAGIIYARTPKLFGKRDQAFEDLTWLAERPETEPLSGFYREVYHHLAILHRDRGNNEAADVFLRKSGYEDDEPKAFFTGALTTTRNEGLTYAATPWIEEVVPDRVFAARGYGFSDVHFVVTRDGAELVVIDAAMQPFSMQAAYERFAEEHGALPTPTTVLVTHAHWDHIGGYTYLKESFPDVRFVGRENFHPTIEHSLRNHSYAQFRSVRYDHAWIRDYAPDVEVAMTTELTIGGTVFELIPATGGETADALLVHMPDERVVFTGDAVMPYYGEPWVEEGFIDEAVETMDAVLALEPEHVLHGHYGLTFIYGREELRVFRDAYAWLVDATRRHVANGYSTKDIVRLNLIPPGLHEHPRAFLGFLAPRNHVVARVADNMTGIWQEDMSGNEPIGVDQLTSAEYGRLLDLYLELTPRDIETMLRRAIDAGDNELALSLALAAEKRYPGERGITALKDEAADRLRSIAQFLDPFRFVVYAEIADKEHKPVPRGPTWD